MREKIHLSRIGTLLVPVLLAGWAWAASAATPAPALASAPLVSDAELASMVKELDAMLTRAFDLPAALKLDPALRTEAEGMRAVHLARMRQLLPEWVGEEVKRQSAARAHHGAGALYYAVFSRLLNELALWQIEPGDPAYERALLEALENSPSVCTLEGDGRFHDFSTRMLRVQAMPPAQRSAALATERELLAHWGKPRAGIQPRPIPMPEEAAMAAVAGIRAGDTRPPQALTPVLASALLAKQQAYAELPGETSCLFQQWWLRTSLMQGAAPATVLNGFRYGTLLTAVERFGPDFGAGTNDTAQPAPGGRPDYPKLARRFAVTGSTRVSRRLDAAGKPIAAGIAGRTIAVPGIRNAPPVAFEDAFDAIAVRYALVAHVPGKAGAAEAPVVDLQWTLDDPSAQTGAAPAQGEKR